MAGADGGADLPATITPQMCSDARAHAAALLAGLDHRVERELIALWLGRLGVLVAGALSAEDVQAKLLAYTAALQDYPTAAFSADTLDIAARTFTFFPAFAELAKLLDAELGRLRACVCQCDLIATSAPRTAGAAKPAPRPSAPLRCWEDPWIAVARQRGRPDIEAALVAMRDDGEPYHQRKHAHLLKLIAPLQGDA